MDLKLTDKVAVVTGGSRGIGRGIAAGLAAEGCHVAICARDRKELEAAAEEMRETGRRILTVELDITSPGAAQQLVNETTEAFGRLDILVNNVGGNRRNLFQETTDKDWEDILDLNFTAHVRVSRAAVEKMLLQKSGSIVFISSIFGRESGGATLSIYNSTKSAMISLAKIMAVELAPHGIRVNSVAPGSIRFPGGSWDKRCREKPEEMAEFIKKELPIGRFGTVEEVADTICFLSSERAGLISGACINVDGCQSRSLI